MYYCGKPTKTTKKPCKRKSKKNIVCWQHNNVPRLIHAKSKGKHLCSGITKKDYECDNYATKKNSKGKYMCHIHMITNNPCEENTLSGLTCLNKAYPRTRYRNKLDKYDNIVMLCNMHALYDRDENKRCKGVVLLNKAASRRGAKPYTRDCMNYPYKYGDGYCRTHADKDIIKICKEEEAEEITAKKLALKNRFKQINKKSYENTLERIRLDTLQYKIDSLLAIMIMMCKVKMDTKNLSREEYFLKAYNIGYSEMNDGETVESFKSKGSKADLKILIQLVSDLHGYIKPKSITPLDIYDDLCTKVIITIYPTKKQRKEDERRLNKPPSIHYVYNNLLREREREKTITNNRKIKYDDLPMSEPLKCNENGSEAIIVLPKEEWNVHNDTQDYYSDDFTIMLPKDRERDKGIDYRDRLLKTYSDIEKYNKLSREHLEEELCEYCNDDDEEYCNDDSDNEDGKICHKCKGTGTTPNQLPKDTQPSDSTLQPFLNWNSPHKSKVEHLDYIMKHGLKICTELINEYNDYIDKCREYKQAPWKDISLLQPFVFDYDAPERYQDHD